jgi:CheY-like chemotaxis protein
MSPAAVLVADDDPDFRELAHLIIESWGVPVLDAVDFTDAVNVARAERARIGLLLLDYLMPGDRDASVRTLVELLGSDKIALCTACGDSSRRAAELGLRRAFSKPLDISALERAVRTLRPL